MRVEKLFTIPFCNLCKYQSCCWGSYFGKPLQKFPTNDFLKKIAWAQVMIGTLWGGRKGVVSKHHIKEIADLPEFLDFCFKKNWVYVEDNPFHRFPWMVWWSWKSEKVEWISLLHHISGWMKEVCTGWEKWEREHLAFQRLGCNLLESKDWRRWWQCWTQILAIMMHHHNCHDVCKLSVLKMMF